MKKWALPILLLFFLFVALLSQKKAVIPIQEINMDNYTLEDAKAEQCVVVSDLKLIQGAELWDDFVDTAKAGTPAEIRIVVYFSPEAASADSPKQDLFVHQLIFDGTQYSFLTNYNGALTTEQFQYLKQFYKDDGFRYGSAITNKTVWFLANDNDAVWYDTQLLYTSPDEPIDCRLVYQVIETSNDGVN